MTVSSFVSTCHIWLIVITCEAANSMLALEGNTAEWLGVGTLKSGGCAKVWLRHPLGDLTQSPSPSVLECPYLERGDSESEG